MAEASIARVTGTELPARLARWLSGWNLAPAFLVHVTGLPGLSAVEADSITTNGPTNGAGRTQSLSSFLDEVQTRRVVEELRTDPGYRTFRNALADPDSTDGRTLYARFREVLAGEAEYIDILEEHL